MGVFTFVGLWPQRYPRLDRGDLAGVVAARSPVIQAHDSTAWWTDLPVGHVVFYEPQQGHGAPFGSLSQNSGRVLGDDGTPVEPRE